jgi:hypothetical protein
VPQPALAKRRPSTLRERAGLSLSLAETKTRATRSVSYYTRREDVRLTAIPAGRRIHYAKLWQRILPPYRCYESRIDRCSPQACPRHTRPFGRSCQQRWHVKYFHTFSCHSARRHGLHVQCQPKRHVLVHARADQDHVEARQARRCRQKRCHCQHG